MCLCSILLGFFPDVLDETFPKELEIRFVKNGSDFPFQRRYIETSDNRR
jgi:hypothetical protein